MIIRIKEDSEGTLSIEQIEQRVIPTQQEKSVTESIETLLDSLGNKSK